MVQPRDFVERWGELSSLEESLSTTQERLAPMADWYSGSAQVTTPPTVSESLKIKNDADYIAFIKGGLQRRTRSHERLIKAAVGLLQARGWKVTTPHPIDLRVSEPRGVIVEAKVVGRFNPVLAVQAAVGQLFEYRRFIGPKESALCILLDAHPGDGLVDYVENDLGLLMVWLVDGTLHWGHLTQKQLPGLALS